MTRRKLFTLLALSGLLAVTIVGSVAVGSVRFAPGEVVAALAGDAADPLTRTIVWDIRLPRTLLAAGVGAALAAGGAAYQGLFRNPLAEPFVVGSASGAALGATLVIVFGGGAESAGLFNPVGLGAFAGAVAAAALTYALAATVRTDPVAGLLLTGVAVGTLLNAAVWVVLSWRDHDLARVVSWLMGSLSNRLWPDLRQAWPGLLAGVAGLCLLARPLDALAEGEAAARALGLRVGPAVALVVGFAGLATATAVAAAGVIGFVGLIAPHVARRLVGAPHAALIPASALLGAALLVAADAAARTLTPVELPVGVLTAALGGPFFLLILRGRS
jgi:iron complex transport system permease protein